jgi:A/G-specific adenine glycosylase
MVDYPNIENLSQLSENDWVEIIRPLGLHWRASPLHKLVQILKKDFKGEIPEDIDQLRMLPGVGDYVSSAYLSLHRNVKASIIDANVVRIYGRFFGFQFNGETRRKKWLIAFANRITPEDRFRVFNYSLLDFAGEICRSKPKCRACFLRFKCAYTRIRSRKHS